ncbi:MAG: hypothetical protein ACKOFW_10540, partial [Planctomycetaceae bacterium]
MQLPLIETITATDPAVRERALDELCDGASLAELVEASRELDQFRRQAGNLYERVRALFFRTTIHRYLIPQRLTQAGGSAGGGGGLLSHA